MTVEIKDIAEIVYEIDDMTHTLTSCSTYHRSFQMHTNMNNDINKLRQKYDRLCEQYICQKLKEYTETRDRGEVENR